VWLGGGVYEFRRLLSLRSRFDILGSLDAYGDRRKLLISGLKDPCPKAVDGLVLDGVSDLELIRFLHPIKSALGEGVLVFYRSGSAESASTRQVR
jgi:hypothetical protein